LSEFLHMMLLPSVPSLAIDSASAILTTAFLNFGRDRDLAFCVETDFRLGQTGDQLRGQFLLVPDAASLRTIFDAVRVH
jgi:chemotaxis protein CheC